MLFSVKNLSFYYREKQVLKDINLEIERGDFLGIIGPNGSGKSTLMRILSGFLTPGEGCVLFKDKDLRDYHIKDLAKEIAVLPQTIDVFYPYTVEDFIAIGRYPHLRWDSDRENERALLEHIMDIMDISGLRGRRVTELSEGERHRVFIAQCIVQDPSVLLLDEPVSHLDIKYQLKTLEVLEGLNSEGLTIIIILHDLNLAAEFCKKIVLMSEGKVYKKGEPQDVLTYENIEDVYKTVVVVKVNPISNKPYIIPVSKRYLKK